MEAVVFEQLCEIMAAMGRGDQAAPFTLYREFGGPIAAMVRSELGRRGVPEIARGDLDGLVIDVCLALRDVARGWQPQRGATPWRWARRRIGNIVDGWVGQHAEPLDSVARVLVRTASPSHVGDELLDQPAEALGELSSRHGVCRLLLDAIDESGTSERDARLLLEVCVQRSLGDRSPAVTVGAMFGLSTSSVRQQVKRARDRVNRVVASEPRYAELAGIPALAA